VVEERKAIEKEFITDSDFDQGELVAVVIFFVK